MPELSLRHDAADDADFLRIVECLIRGAALTSEAQFYVVKVDNWFGPKWLGFNHKILGAAGVYVPNAAAPQVVPPFTPSRILSTLYCTHDAHGSWDGQPAQLHVRQTSEGNAHRTLQTVLGDDGAFWWTGATATNGRGAVMAYLPGHRRHVGWYAGFKRADQVQADILGSRWTTTELRGTSRKALLESLHRLVPAV